MQNHFYSILYIWEIILAFACAFDSFFLSAEMSPEHQRAVVHKQLSVVTDEIFRILEVMMGEYEAEVSSSHKESQRQRQPPDIALKMETNLQRTGTLYI